MLAAACGDDLVAPQLGTIRVTTETTGGDFDADGYEVVLNAEVRRLIAANATTILAGVRAGVHAVALERVAENCEVSGSRTLSVSVPPDGSTEVGFQVLCASTGLDITTRSTGFDIPSRYELIVDGRREGFIDANGSRVLGRLAPGRHTVALVIPTSRCAVDGYPITAEVANRSVTPVLLEVTCLQRAPEERPEKIAYVFDSTVSGPWVGLLDIETSKTTTLTRGESPAWSPDGTRLVFSDDGALIVIDPETGDRRTLNTAGPAFEPAWAPTGEAIAFVGPNERQLYIVKLDGSPPVAIATPLVVWVPDVAWSPDGQRIAFTCGVSSFKPDICSVNREGTQFLQLTSGPFRYSQPSWSPDGGRIAVCRETPWDHGCDIVLMGANGTAVSLLTIGSSPAWSPDGSKLVFADTDGLFTINVDGSNRTRLTTGRHHSPVWRPVDPCAGCWDY